MIKDNFRHDRRRMRADALMNLIIRTALECKEDTTEDPHRFEQELYERLGAELNKYGAEIISDSDRAQYGLSPRGPDGWTAEEITALEQKRLEALTKPMNFSQAWNSAPSVADLDKVNETFLYSIPKK